MAVIHNIKENACGGREQKENKNNEELGSWMITRDWRVKNIMTNLCR